MCRKGRAYLALATACACTTCSFVPPSHVGNNHGAQTICAHFASPAGTLYSSSRAGGVRTALRPSLPGDRDVKKRNNKKIFQTFPLSNHGDIRKISLATCGLTAKKSPCSSPTHTQTHLHAHTGRGKRGSASHERVENCADSRQT